MAGFFGKLWIFRARRLEVAQGPDTRAFQFLAVVGVLNAAIGAYYYLRILIKMVFNPGPRSEAPTQADQGGDLGRRGVLRAVAPVLPLNMTPLNRAARDSAEAASALPEVKVPPTQDRGESLPTLPQESNRRSRQATPGERNGFAWPFTGDLAVSYSDQDADGRNPWRRSRSALRRANHPRHEHGVGVEVLRPDLQLAIGHVRVQADWGTGRAETRGWPRGTARPRRWSRRS